MNTQTESAREPFMATVFPFTATIQNGTAHPSARAPGSLASRGSSPRELAYKLAAFLLMGDGIVAGLAILAGLELREWQRTGGKMTLSTLPMIEPRLVAWSASGSLLFIWFMLMLKTYETKNLYRMQTWLMNLIKSTMLCAATVWAYIGVMKITDFSPRIGVVYGALFLLVGVGLWRLCSFVFLINPRIKEAVSARVIVIGWNERAASLRHAMRRDLAQMGEVIGCIPPPGGRCMSKPPKGLAVLGDFSDLPELVAECQANSIILADVSMAASDIQQLIAFTQRELLGFQMIPDYFPALNSGLQVQTVSGVSLLGVSRLPLDSMVNRMMKRLIDIFGAAFGLVITFPIVVLFCAIVYAESPGPVLYKQRRTSRSGRTFLINKIRSMRLNAEAASGAVWCKKEDDRRLRIGAFMRRWNIDELPQFWNVLIGDMSLVGPRPERPELIEKFKEEIPNYNARHEVRSGLTGWAQVQGLRGDTDLTLRIEADLYYLENWSLFFDFYCIVRTFFKPENAM
jgi:exopolysaccharide biosynthesis polyprenyl glycosylphosphotransferase